MSKSGKKSRNLFRHGSVISALTILFLIFVYSTIGWSSIYHNVLKFLGC